MLDFLLENPLLLLIILGMISAAFKKGSDEENKKPVTQNRPMPQDKPLEEPEPFSFPDFEPMSSPEPPAEKSFSEKRKQIEERLAALKEQEIELSAKAERIEEAAVNLQMLSQSKKDAEKRGHSHSFELDRTDLVNGIILSEVLGPPRAKRPHRTLTRR